MEGKNASVKAYYPGYTSQSEDAGWLDKVAYHGYETESGQTEIRDHVSVMTGVQTAIDGKFAPIDVYKRQILQTEPIYRMLLYRLIFGDVWRDIQMIGILRNRPCNN